MPPADSGHDAGKPDAGGRSDAGKPDAGPVDAGFVSAPIAQWCLLQAVAQCDRDIRCLELGAANRPECLSKKSELPCFSYGGT